MKTRRAAGIAIWMALFVPACLVAYHLTTVFVAGFAEPLIAPVGPWAIIDHFHVELYLEVLFLTACLAMRLQRWLVWLIGGIVIPTSPVVWQAIVYVEGSIPPLPHRTFEQDSLLWLVESVSAGLVSCLLWHVVYRAIPSPSSATAASTGS